MLKNLKPQFMTMVGIYKFYALVLVIQAIARPVPAALRKTYPQ